MSSSPLSFKYIIILACALLVLACSQSLYVPSVETAANTNRIPELTAGRKLYVQKCGSCHNLYRPENFTKEKWTTQMVEMKKEAKINEAQAELILEYLTGYKTGTR